jgi:predicted Zn-dependent peptidase
VLPNGLRFYVRSNKKPAQRAALALVIRVGSLAETEAERGVAHFVEHLAFNATDAYDHHELVAFLEASGLAFGACQNAYTSCDETCFELLVPTDAPGLLQRALSILAQFACRIRIAPGDVDAERGAILEEWRGGRDARGRAAEAAWKMMNEGSPYAERLPIGLESVIRGADAATVRGFYLKWYRPENMAIVAVGDWSDEERAGVVAAVRDTFGAVAPPEDAPTPAPALPSPTFVPHARPRAACHSERALTDSTVQLSFKSARAPLRSAAEMRLHLVRDLFETCLSARLFRASRGAMPPFYSASVGIDAPLACVDTVTLGASAPVDGILDALRALHGALASVRAHGFTAPEVRRAKARIDADIQQAWVEREQAYSTGLRDEYVRHFLSGEAVIDADTEARLARALLRSIDDEEVAAVAQPLTSAGSCVVRAACGSAERRPPSDAELLGVLADVEADEAAGRIPPPAAADATPDELLPHAPVVTDAARIASRRDWPRLDVVELRLPNGMRVAYKRTAFLDDQILISAFAHGGLSEVPPVGGRRYASAACASLLAGEAGVFGHAPETLDDILAGRRCAVSPVLGAYRRDFGGDQSPDDLDAALALCHALFVSTPDAPEEELAVALRMTRESIRAQARDPQWRFANAVKQLNYGGCYYLEPLTEAGLARVDPAVALSTFDAAFRNPAEFTMCICGAIEDTEKLEALIEQFLGTIPATDTPPPRAPRDITPLPWRFPAAPVRREVRVAMAEPQAAAQLTWPLTIGGGAAGAAAVAGGARAEAKMVLESVLWARLACRVLESRLLKKMRFQFGDVYSVSVSPYYGLEAPSSPPPLRGDCAVSFSCDPDAAWRLVELALEELALLQADGPAPEDCATAAELDRRAFELSQAENSFWLERMVAGYQARACCARCVRAVRAACVLPSACVRSVSQVSLSVCARRVLAGDDKI